MHRLRAGALFAAFALSACAGAAVPYSRREMWLMGADGANAAPVYPDGPTLWGENTGWFQYAYWQPVP